MKVQKSKNKKINTSIQDKSTDLNSLNSVRLLNNVTFPTRKKRTADADEDAKINKNYFVMVKLNRIGTKTLG